LPTLCSTLFPYTTLFRSLAIASLPLLAKADCTARLEQRRHKSSLESNLIASREYAAISSCATMKPFTSFSIRSARSTSPPNGTRSEEHTSELQSLAYLVC